MSMLFIQGQEEKSQRIHYEVDTSLPALGEGGMGQVRRGVRIDEKTGVKTDVAIKFLFDDLSENAIARARREASIRIHNENLVEMFGFVELEVSQGNRGKVKRYHVVSELLEGVMLFDVIKGKTTDRYGKEVAYAQELYQMYCNERFRFAVLVTRNVLSGLMALHDFGYIHRDIDPSNIMVTHDRKIKLIDFGIAKKFGTDESEDDDMHLTNSGQFVGKAAYAAPELVLGDIQHQNRTTDLYAVGVMLYQFIMGKLPFEGTMMELIQKQIHVKMPLKDIPYKSLRYIIGKATEKKQEKRYHSAAEMRVALEHLTSEDAKIPSSESGFMMPLLQNKKILYGIAGGLLAAALITCAVMFWPFSGTNSVSGNNDNVLDTISTTIITDEQSGISGTPISMLIDEAAQMLNNPATAQEGINKLKDIVSNYGDYRHSAQAFAILAALTQPVDADVSSKTVKKMRENTKNLISRDAPLAHKYSLKAYELDSTCYEGIFELATDFAAAATRTGDDSLQDFNRSLKLFQKGIEFARRNNDEVYVKLFETRIDQVTSALE